MKKNWLIKKKNKEIVEYISRRKNINPILAKVLLNRGLNTLEKIDNFYKNDLSTLSGIVDMKGGQKCVARVERAIKDDDKVLISGDFDADGVTSTAIMMSALLARGVDVRYFTPNRFEHGYGFHRDAIDMAVKDGVSLVITVDCGQTDFDTVDYAGAKCHKSNWAQLPSNDKAIDVIVTDHHEPRRDANNEPILPKAYSIVNPKLDGEEKPYFTLTAAGIALKIAMALLPYDDIIKCGLFELAAIGTIADVAPIVDENRIIVKKGLELLQNTQNLGISTLLKKSGVKNGKKYGVARRLLSPIDLSFSIIPRINAAGRLADAGCGVELFITQSTNDAEKVSAELHGLNTKRQRLEEGVLDEALKIMGSNTYDKAVLVWDKDWHEGVLGIVAARIVDRFNKPAFVFTLKDGMLKGSARSTEAINLHKCIGACEKWVIRYGGHKQAAGLQLKLENLPHFEKAINEYIEQTYRDEELSQTLLIDAHVSLSDVTEGLLEDFEKIAPFGVGNLEPLLAVKGVRMVNPRIVGKNHLKCQFASNGSGGPLIEAIGWNMGLPKFLKRGALVDVVFTVGINEWNGRRMLQLCIKDIRHNNSV